MGGGLVADTFETDPESLVLEQMELESSQGCSKRERTLVLLGRKGNGKSATGNSILEETKFKSEGSADAITEECELQKTKLPTAHVVNVIDTPGLFSASSAMEFASREIVKCLSLAKDGIDAVLLVFSARNRLTEEEQSTLRTLKSLFGSRIVDYIIVVFTNADALDEDGQTLEKYLQKCPAFQEILDECDDRKVLLDNRRKVPKRKKEKQIQDFLDLVEQIAKKNNGQSFMVDLSLKLRQKKKQIEAMNNGLSSKQQASELKVLEVIQENARENGSEVSNLLKESLREVKEQLLKAEAAKEAVEKTMKEKQKLSADEIRELREQLDKARKETADSHEKVNNKNCTNL